MSDRERDSIQEMEDIQKGLEAFLQQEMQEMQTSGSGSGKSGTGRRTAERPAPQMFDMTENDEDEEELDVIGSGRRARADDYAEDWDDPAYRKRQVARRETTRKTSENRNSGDRSNSNADRRRQAASDRPRRSRREDYADEYEDYEDHREKNRSGRKKKKSGFKRFLIAVALILVFLAAGLYVLVGNVGGQPYWSWYGFDSRVEWCACFVSWCYGQSGRTEPRFAGCQSQGVPWFQSHGQWGARGYENIAPGDAIFFDWDLDGSADHVGIVIGTDGSRVYTVEGNSGDACKIKSYDLNYQSIKGYGLMNW